MGRLMWSFYLPILGLVNFVRKRQLPSHLPISKLERATGTIRARIGGLSWRLEMCDCMNCRSLGNRSGAQDAQFGKHSMLFAKLVEL
jgi:hypothetical protein